MRDNFRCMRQGGELHILHAGVRECIHTFSFCRLQHDKMMHLASIYKTAGRLLYALLLFLGFITIVCVSIQSRVRSSVKAPGGASALNESTTPELTTPGPVKEYDIFWPTTWPDQAAEGFRFAVFGLAILSTFVLGIVAYVNPDDRWHHLRAHSAKLQSLVWHYRTRTGLFGDSGTVVGTDKRARADKLFAQELRELTRRIVKSVSSHDTHTYRGSS